MQGFSERNIWNMIRFYEFYSKNEKLQPLAAEISWSNNIIILEKCETDFQKEYYLKLAKKTHLSKRVLQNKIESHEFERVLSENKANNFGLTLEEEQAQLVENTIKDSYIFDFLSLGDEYKERELEAELIQNLKKFILEL
jgi:predicted nuclease of restriction endonuclease-like (RecB) superfamily